MLHCDHLSVGDFDLRPRRPAPPMPMMSTLHVDDDDDLLDALAAAAVARWQQDTRADRDARHIALAALPSVLCTPSAGTAWTAKPRKPRRQPDRMMVGTLVSAVLALFMLVAAMVWRLENPRVVHVEGATPAIHAAQPEVDAISSASPR